MLKKLCPYILFVVLFILYLPISSRITFHQNDDWYYYKGVQNFLQANFRLDPQIAPTFYGQGWLGAFYTLITGGANLAYLTLLLSITNCILVYVILKKYFYCKDFWSLIISSFLFFNPIYQYLSLGFMTEVYFLFYFLLSTLFYLHHLKTTSLKTLLIANVFSLLAILTRQVGLVLPISFLLHMGIKNKRSYAVPIQAAFLLVQVFALWAISKTPEMARKSLMFHHLVKPSYITNTMLGSLIYISIFCAPFIIYSLYTLFFSTFKKTPIKISVRNFLILMVSWVLLFFFIQKIFKPQDISWGEFPYFENTMERTGYIPREIHGTKYYFSGSHDFYRTLDFSGKVLLAGLFLDAVVKTSGGTEFKKIFQVTLWTKFWETLKTWLGSPCGFLMITGILYVFVILLAETFYDRYLMPLIMISLIYAGGKVISHNESGELKENQETAFPKFWIFLSTVYFVPLAFLTWQFSLDYIWLRNTIWHSAQTIASPEKYSGVYVNTAWNEEHSVDKNNIDYLFSYDSREVNPQIHEKFDLIKTFAPKYKPNIFVNPAIYLYKSKYPNTALP